MRGSQTVRFYIYSVHYHEQDLENMFTFSEFQVGKCGFSLEGVHHILRIPQCTFTYICMSEVTTSGQCSLVAESSDVVTMQLNLLATVTEVSTVKVTFCPSSTRYTSGLKKQSAPSKWGGSNTQNNTVNRKRLRAHNVTKGEAQSVDCQILKKLARAYYEKVKFIYLHNTTSCPPPLCVVDRSQTNSNVQKA